ncbi:DMT family transporter [Fischerella sp. PCC 9605]|uniref:DMT family transporter n=1 Tax=Fischerella sp. PCC 9605 TaxID=1173024 RepID=UPI0004B4AE35|nr:DMT family transporter [Fischerella sp. PCC 9605]
MSSNSRTLALGSGCLAALGWGLTGTFVKLLTNLTTFEVLSIRLLVAFLTTLPIFLIHRQLLSDFLALVRKPIGLLLSSLMMFYYLFAVRAFQLAPVSDVVLIVGLSPIIGLVAKAFIKKQLKLLELFGALTSFTGLVLFVLPKLQGSSDGQSEYLTGLFFAFLSACITLSYASLFKHYAGAKFTLNPATVAFTTFAIGSFLITPVVVLSSPDLFTHFIQPHQFFIALGLGVLSTVVPTFCYGYAAKQLSPILTTTLNLLTPIFASGIAFFLLREQLSFWSIIGALLIFAGIITLSLPQPRKR